MPKRKKKLRTYIVPVIHHCSFGMEVEVEASNMKEAKLEARKGGDTSDNDGYDWNRFQVDRISVGSWQKIKRKPNDQ